jgi:hypothetical protein
VPREESHIKRGWLHSFFRAVMDDRTPAALPPVRMLLTSLL